MLKLGRALVSSALEVMAEKVNGFIGSTRRSFSGMPLLTRLSTLDCSQAFLHLLQIYMTYALHLVYFWLKVTANASSNIFERVFTLSCRASSFITIQIYSQCLTWWLAHCGNWMA